MTKNSIIFSLSLALLLVVGCGGGGKVGMSGKVVYSDDKSPLPMGTVYLETDSFLARGTIRSDGTFDVGSLGEKDGLPPGTYRVSIRDASKPIGQDANGDPIYEPLIDPNSITGLTVEITSTTRDFVIEVDRYAPTRR